MAARDIQRLYRFLATKNPDAARRAVRAIRLGVVVLAREPAVGRPADDLPDELRDWWVDFGDTGYVVRYRLNAQGVTILAVRHQREVGF